MKKKNHMKINRFAIYVKTSFALMKKIKKNLEKWKKSEITVITLVNTEKLLIVTVI